MTSGELADGLNRFSKAACVRAKSVQCVWLFAKLWTVAHQAPLSMTFSRQEYWSGLPFPPLGGLPGPGTEPSSLVSPALAGGFFTTRAIGKPLPKLAGEDWLQLLTLQGSSKTWLPREGFLNALPHSHSPPGLSSLLSPPPFLRNRPSLGFPVFHNYLLTPITHWLDSRLPEDQNHIYSVPCCTCACPGLLYTLGLWAVGMEGMHLFSETSKKFRGLQCLEIWPNMHW